MVTTGTVTAYKPGIISRVRRTIEKAFKPLPPGNIGIGGYSTPITNVIPEKYVSDYAKNEIAKSERISNLTSGYSSGGSSSGGSSSGGSSSGSSGGGRPGSPSSPSNNNAAQEQARQEAARQEAARQQAAAQEQARQQAAEQKRNQNAALREQQRIEQERKNLISSGAQVNTISSRDYKTKDPLQITTTIKGGRKILDVKNVKTGKITTTTYAPPRGGGSVRQSGGISSTPISTSPPVKIQEYNADISNINLNNRTTDFYIDKVDENIVPYKQSWLESTKQSGGRISDNIKKFFTGKDFKFDSITKPFEYSGQLKKENIAYIEPQFGTAITNPVTGKIETGIKTYGDVQSEREIQRTIEILKLPNSDTERINKVYEKYPDVPNLYERSGSKVKDIAPVVTDIGVTTALTLTGSPLASAGYLTFRGVQSAAKGRYKDVYSGTELYAGVRKQSQESKQAGMYLGFAATSAITAPFKISKELDILRLKESINKPSATIGKIYNINDDKWIKSITRQKSEYYEASTNIDFPIFDKGAGKFSIGVGKGSQKSYFLPFSEQIGDSGWLSLETQFSSAGRGVSRTAIKDGIVLSDKYKAVIGEGYVTPTKITKFDFVKTTIPAEVKSIRGDFDITGFGKKIFQLQKINIKPSGLSNTFTFGGITKDTGKLYKGYSGKFISKRLYFKELDGPLEITDDAISLPLKTRGVVNVKDVSKIFKEAPFLKEDLGFTVKKIGGKSSQEFYQKLYQTTPDVSSFGSGASKTISKTITKEFITPTSSLKLPSTVVKTSSIYAGTGQYEISTSTTLPQTLNYSGFSIMKNDKTLNTISQSNNKFSLKLLPLEKTKTRNKTMQKLSYDFSNISKTKQENVLRLSPAVRQDSRQINKQIQKQESVFGFTPFNPKPPIQPEPIKPIGGGFWFPKMSSTRTKSSNFGVQIRRGGKFFNVGNFKDLDKALQRGKQLTSTSLAATYKITGNAKLPKAPKGYYAKKDKEGLLFIEKKQFRLSKLPEVKEIQMAKRKSVKKRKKK